MLYHVTIGGRTITVELSEGRAIVDGADVERSELLALGADGAHQLMTGASSTAFIARSPQSGTWDLLIEGRRLTAEVVDERTRAIRALTRATSGPAGPRPIRAPMPGMIVRIEAAVGDAVQPGQGVLIMEAMKMENELRADAAGVVSRIHVAPGQAVEKGAVLVEFQAEEAGGNG
ncbi:MAG TPA: biotin/lipoyl-containing protein [Longimicrobiales bacterium]